MSEKILIVDDDTNLLRLLGYALERAGYRPIIATRGEEALAKVRQEEPDLLILDVMLPGIDGNEVCLQLRQDPQTEALPIIMLSARTQVSDKIEGLEAGADEYLTKPISPKEMVARVKALLARTSRLRATRKGAARGGVVGVIGAKGGVGATTVALNLGAALVQSEQSVVVAELRPHFGSFTSQLNPGTHDTLTLLLEMEPEAIDERSVKARITPHPTGLQVLYGPEDGYHEISAEQAAAIVRSLLGLAKYIFLDLPDCPSPATQEVLRQCDEIVLVLEPEPASAAGGAKLLDLFNTLGVPRSNVVVVAVTQKAVAAGMTVQDLRKELNCDIHAAIPPAADACTAAQKRGRPLILTHPDHPASARLRALAQSLVAQTQK